MPASKEVKKAARQQGRSPNRTDFAPQNIDPAAGKSGMQSERRYMYRTPGKKVARGIEWREERHAEAAVRHGVQQTVGGSDQEQQHCQREDLLSTRPAMSPVSAEKNKEWVSPR
jgi:hypothetical protein